MSFLPSTLSAPDATHSSELELRVKQTREHAAHEMLPKSMLVGLIAALGILWVLWDEVPHVELLIWCGARALINAIRFGHAMLFLRWRTMLSQDPMHTYRVLACIDGLIWGAMGWAMTPLGQLDVAVVTISACIGIAALGAFILHVDMPSTGLFIAPILLPNAFYAAGRHDRLGIFCMLAFIGLTLFFLLEARRSNRRIIELLRLRFQSEQVALAQAEALNQARVLSETKSRFVATMSHEMRTPLHGILGLVRLLRQRENDPLASRQLDLIRSSGDHLVNVINDVLDFARLEADGLPVHQQRFNLHSLLSEMAETANVTACDKGLELVLEIGMSRDTDVRGDPVRIRQILHNLLGNAIKFTQHGSVSLLVTRDADSNGVRFHVKDTGIGIPADELALIFDAFHQAEGTYQRRFGGTGLGLTISRELARAMGGDITCSSRPGEGSTFTFALPLPVVAGADVVKDNAAASRPTHEKPQRDTHESAQDHAPHVLLVEDNPVNALVAEAELQRLGVQVTVLTNGRQALDWLEHQPADLVLMDCEMPEMDGIEATGRIRARERATGKPPVRIVALTANGMETYVERCVAAGMNDHLSKPFRPDELERTLSRHLRLSTTQR
jgi:signal transduction histidine kinase/ActR/RegA family two-component response regulator